MQAKSGSANLTINSLETVALLNDTYQSIYPVIDAMQMYKNTKIALKLNTGNAPPIMRAVINKRIPPDS